MQCPCNPSKKYSDCCEKAHQNIQTVLTAETLMRSRYSAFVLAKINYLQESHHSRTRPSNKEKKEILSWTKSVKWLKLEVLNTSKGSITDLEGTVEFNAFFMENGKVDVIHENSSFCKENKHWVYLNAN
ncbi:Sec-C motif domain protein [Tenacibaculum soleae]|uniref:YchJ family protein n=1 Tax=Tenacibaculum soleae TaxID=447689 RepID=UPI003AB8F93C